MNIAYLLKKKINNSFFEKILSIVRYFYFLFDNKNLYNFRKNKIDLLIVSNLINTNLNQDYYFGNLEKILKKRKINCIKVFRNLSNQKTKFFFKYKKKNFRLLSKRTKIFNECKYIYIFLRKYFFFKISLKHKLSRKNISFFDYLSIIGNMRTVDQIIEVIKILNPKCLIFTYEGHPWERLLIHECNKRNIISIAYQFSTIAQNQLGIFKNFKKKYSPDYIATSGNITKNIFLKKKLYSKVFKLGSCKFQNNAKLKLKQKKILVAIDSDFVMMQEMLNFTIELAIKNTNTYFIIRLHPLSISNFFYLNFIKNKIKNISNIKLSHNTLKTDLKQSKILIYRESSICILALNYNIKIYFFGTDKTVNFFDNKFPDLHNVKDSRDIELMINKKYKNKKYFENYKKNYFTKFSLNNLIKIINNA